MKDDESRLTTVTTATLELGIDIGRLERAFQIDAPFTVSSFLQRMGRTGRRDDPPEMWFVMREERARAAHHDFPRPSRGSCCRASPSCSSTLRSAGSSRRASTGFPTACSTTRPCATLASCGELSPAALAERVLTLSYFHRVTQDDFRLLLRHLLETDHIERTEAGGLIVGPRRRAHRQLVQVLRRVPGERGIHRAAANRRRSAPSCSRRPPARRSPSPGTSGSSTRSITSATSSTARRSRGRCPPISATVPATSTPVCSSGCAACSRKTRDLPLPHAERRGTSQASRGTSAANAGLAEQPLMNLGGDMWCLCRGWAAMRFSRWSASSSCRCADRFWG